MKRRADKERGNIYKVISKGVRWREIMGYEGGR